MSDLIDRKEAVDSVKNEMLSWLEGDSHDYRKVVDAIMDLPTVDAEPVIHGKWLTAYGEHISFGVRPHVSFCSECNEVTAFKYIYCPNCGARMDGTQRKPCDDCQQFDCYGCEYAERKEE